MKKRKNRWLAPVATVAFFAAALVFWRSGVSDARETADAEGLRIAEQSVRRGSVACYATEGRYPQTYEYLRQNYGVRVDEQKYAVHYEIFAENIMPDISVSERKAKP